MQFSLFTVSYNLNYNTGNSALYGGNMIRKADISDLDEILRIFEYARKFMKENGNPNQWGNSRPSENVVINDIRDRNCYVFENKGLQATFTLIQGIEPTYTEILGKWLDDSPYTTIHRIASNGEIKGVMYRCLEFAFSKYSNVRIDTHKDNIIMRHIIEKSGFTYCGIIRVEDGSERLAYQKII